MLNLKRILKDHKNGEQDHCSKEEALRYNLGDISLLVLIRFEFHQDDKIRKIGHEKGDKLEVRIILEDHEAYGE